MATRDISVEGMHCASCGMLIDEALEELPGVVSSSTNLRRKRTRVEFDPAATDLDEVVRTITELGYRVEPA